MAFIETWETMVGLDRAGELKEQAVKLAVTAYGPAGVDKVVRHERWPDRYLISEQITSLAVEIESMNRGTGQRMEKEPLLNQMQELAREMCSLDEIIGGELAGINSGEIAAASHYMGLLAREIKNLPIIDSDIWDLD